MITSPIETLELPNFGHVTKSTVSFESHDKILLMTPWKKLWHHNLYFEIP